MAISFVCFLLLDEVEDGGGWTLSIIYDDNSKKEIKLDDFENIEYKADVLYPKNSGSICLQDNSLIIDVSKKSAVLIKLTKVL